MKHFQSQSLKFAAPFKRWRGQMMDSDGLKSQSRQIWSHTEKDPQNRTTHCDGKLCLFLLTNSRRGPLLNIVTTYKWRYEEGHGGLCWILLQGRHVLVWASYDLYWSAQALSKVGMSTFWQAGFVRQWQKMCYLRSISRIVANIKLVDYRNVLRNAYWSRSTINNGITY